MKKNTKATPAKAQAAGQGSSRKSSSRGALGRGEGYYSKRLNGKAPSGTTDLSVSDATQRKRNHEMDEYAAGRSRRVGDIRKAERAKRNRAKYRSYIIKIAAAIAAVLIIVFGSIFIYRSDLLKVESVTVSGVSHLTDQEVTQLAAVPDDSTLLRLDTQGICDRLCEHPWVKSASIARQFPNTIEIQVTERSTAAAVKINNNSIWVISTDGAWLSAATKDDWKSNRRIVDVDPNMSDPVAGSDCSDEGILNALSIYDSVSDDFASQIKSISAESKVKTTLNLKSGIKVAFGDADDVELKVAAIESLLEKYEGKISYINVRVPDRPSYRTLEDDEKAAAEAKAKEEAEAAEQAESSEDTGTESADASYSDSFASQEQ